MAIYFIFIVFIVRRGGPTYPLFLLAALVPFQYFTGTVNDGLNLAKKHSSVIANIPINPVLLPLSSLFSGVATMLLSFVVFVPFLILYGITPWPAALWVPLLVLQVMWVTAGPVYAATIIGVYLPGLRGPIGNLLRVSLFLSSGLLALRGVNDNVATTIARYNPLSPVFDSFRAVLLQNTSPGLADITYSFLAGAVMLVLGLTLFWWRASEIAKEV